MKPELQIDNRQIVSMVTWFKWLSLLALMTAITYWYATIGHHTVEDVANILVYNSKKTSELAIWITWILWAILLGACFRIVAQIIYLIRGPDPIGPVMNK